MSNKSPNQKDLYQIRLEARKMRLEREAEASQMRLQNNVTYATKNAPKMIGTSVSQAISKKNATLGKLVGTIGFGVEDVDTRTVESVSARHYDRKDVKASIKKEPSKWINLAEKLLLPLVLTLGRRQIMALGLRGSGKIVGSALRMATKGLFGKKKK